MTNKPLVLLIEDNPVDALLIKDILTENNHGFNLQCVDTLSAGLECLANKESKIEVVLLDLYLPDSHGLDTFSSVHNYIPDLPIVIITSLDDETSSIRAVQEGAQDYLIKGQVSGQLLIRSIRYAIERKQTETALEREQFLLRSLLDTHPDSIFFKDSFGKYIKISKAYAVKSGYTDPNQLIGKTDFDIFSHDNASLFLEYENMIMKTGMPMVNQEVKETFDDKGPTWFLSTKMPLLDKEGNIVGTFGISHDITERKQVEEALSDSRKRYKSLFDDSPTPMWEEDFSEVKNEIDKLKESGISDFAGFFESNPEIVKKIIKKVKVLDINKAVLTLHNAYRKEEIINDLTIVFTEQTYIAIAHEFTMIAQGVRTFDFNKEVRTIDNKVRYLIVRWTAVSGYETSLSRVVIAIIDITEHKQAEAALRESESMLNEAQRVAHIGSWTFDPETRDITWSDELFRIYGLDPQKGIPQIDEQRKFFKAAEWEKFQEVIQNLKKNGDNFEIELNFKRPGGEKRTCLINGQLKHIEPEKLLIVGTAQDITDRKKVEKELRIYREYLEEMIKVRTEELEETKRQNELILNAVGDGIFGIDIDGRITFINPAAAHMLGWEIEEILGQRNDMVIPVTKPDGSRYLFTESPIHLTTRDGQTRRVIDELFWNKNGTSFPAEYLCTPIWENNQLIGGVVVFSDITEQKKAEKALEKAKEAAEMATKAKSEFLANMSHEIRTPMNSIIGFADLLALSVKDEKQQSQVDSIRNSAKNLLIIINDILDLSKIEAGKLKFEFEPVNLRYLAKDIENIFAQKIKEKGLQLIVDLHPEIPNTIIIDDIRLRQVLFNLIGNAIKFTEQGVVKLTIKSITKIGEDKNVDLFISVEDTGIGIKKEQQQIIFEAFNQQVGQSTKKYGGTGLGLTITKRLVEMMGGTISLQSKSGEGSTFEITIPGLEFSNREVMPRDEKTFDPASVIFEKAKVLICDDNPSDRQLILDLLENYPLSLLVAENGESAVEMASENHPDVILMDLKMPEMNGTEAAIILRNSPDTRTIPIIVISASSTVNTLKEEHKSIFDDFLLKPIELGDLVESLKKFLKHGIVEKTKGFEELLQQEIVLTQEQKNNLPEVIRILEEDFAPVYGEMMQNRKIDQIEAFGIKLAELAERFDFNVIHQYGDKIKTLASNFDIEKLLIALKLFPGLIDKLIKMRG